MTYKEITNEEAWKILKEVYEQEGETKEDFLSIKCPWDKQRITYTSFVTTNGSFPLYQLSITINKKTDSFAISTSRKPTNAFDWWETCTLDTPRKLLLILSKFIQEVSLWHYGDLHD